MRGISSIRGTTTPLVGQDTFYEVSELYLGTVISDYNQVKWKVFRKANRAYANRNGDIASEMVGNTEVVATFSLPGKINILW